MNILETVKDTIHNICACILGFFDEELTLTRKTLIIISSICALGGIIGGFIVSPIKKGVYINIANNGNSYQDDEE